MAFGKYLKKRGGYATLTLLISAMIIIIPLLAITFRQAMKFSDLAIMRIRQKQEEIVVLTSINESVEYLLKSRAYDPYLPEGAGALINPGSSSELFIRKSSETIGQYTLLTEIYDMNYVISDDIDVTSNAVMSDILNFPPSQRAVAGNRHFLIKITVHKNETPSYRKETAVEIAASGNVSKLWSREFFLY